MARESPAVRVTHASPGICPSTDILLAASEACANVVLHAGQSVHAYEVAATVGAAGCRVEVTDDEMFAPGPVAARDLAESGRGFAVMRACVDGVWLRSAPGHGTSVVLDKRIRWEPPVPVPA